ncbi:MAG: hypothetical protein CL470_03690 [Acidimicrobiaceae bacterium]|nr:hypothetical protein [Acidimicrobiaceae bacterium]
MLDIAAPDYSGACVSNIVPALLQHKEIGQGWIPNEILDANQVVLLVLDGLGYKQFQRYKHLLPSLSQFHENEISTVFPTTTSTALTSITTGSTPGEHGVVGYKIRVGTQTLNILRWTTESGPAHLDVEPEQFQPIIPFNGTNPTVVSPAAFVDGGFTSAHLRFSKYAGYWMSSSIATEIGDALRNEDPFVYAYYDGLDKIGHIKGFGPHYEAELRHIDHIVESVVNELPSGTALVVTADHGMVQIGDNLTEISPTVLEMTTGISGEARFVWLHSKEKETESIHDKATEAHGEIAWVFTREDILGQGWFGREVSDVALARLGQVALVVHAPTALVPDKNSGPNLVARHGSVTDEERLVPLLTLKTG